MSKIIIQNGNMCELDLPLKFAQKLYQEFSVRHPNAFYLRTRQRGMQNWDGKIHYINKHGEFKIGFLPAVYEKCIEYGIKPKVVDMRKPLPKVKKVVTKIGKYKLRPEQEKAVKAIISNQVGNSLFQIGVLDYTVNAGKTLIMSSLYLSYKRQLKTLLITNDSDWLNQAREEFKQYLPGEDITFVQGKVLNWSNFTIGMVQSISRNMRFYQQELSKIDMVLVDEADQGGSKQYQNVLTRLFNTRIRIGLSGTIYMSKLAKDKVKNMNLECFFGKVIAEFKLKDSIKKGYSTKTIVKMVPSRPWYGNWESEFVTYKDIYDDSITLNKYAKRMAYARLKWNINQGRYPALVVCKHIAHCENLYKFFKKKLGDAYNIAYVHVNTPSKLRQQIMKDFREGKIDILVSTTIIARGKNFPKLRYLLNAASMNSQEKSIQFLGRLVRTDESKNKVYLDDLHYPGNYLSRHGRHRKQYYQKQELKVILLEKLWKNHPIHSL
jgi:superfamily II DNA or RNA helicase